MTAPVNRNSSKNNRCPRLVTVELNDYPLCHSSTPEKILLDLTKKGDVTIRPKDGVVEACILQTVRRSKFCNK